MIPPGARERKPTKTLIRACAAAQPPTATPPSHRSRREPASGHAPWSPTTADRRPCDANHTDQNEHPGCADTRVAPAEASGWLRRRGHGEFRRARRQASVNRALRRSSRRLGRNSWFQHCGGHQGSSRRELRAMSHHGPPHSRHKVDRRFTFRRPSIALPVNSEPRFPCEPHERVCTHRSTP